MQATAPAAPANSDAQSQTRAQTGRGLLVIGVGAMVLALLIIVHIRQGMASISPETIIDAIFNPNGSPEHAVGRYARLPRVAAGLVGVNAGAYLAVIAASIFAPALLTISSPLVAFSGGLIAAVVVYSLATGSASTPTRLALAGMAITLGLGSITSTLILFNEYTITGLYFWGSGSLIQRNWMALDNTWYWVLLIGIGATLFLSKALDLMGLGDDVATSLGQNVRAIRLIATLAGVMSAAFSVSIAGSIGFVGLVAPHLVRLSGVRHHRLLLPAAALWGAVILLGADVLGRIVAGQYTELPAGVFTALVGAPWMIWLARRVGRGQGGAFDSQSC